MRTSRRIDYSTREMRPLASVITRSECRMELPANRARLIPVDCSPSLTKRRISLTARRLAWPLFWKQVRAELAIHSYARDTQKVYRHVLRCFSQFADCSPRLVTPEAVHRYIGVLADRDYSWSWLSTNIAVLRTVFDKLSGCRFTRYMVTPKRPWRLPTILSRSETLSILRAPSSIRDRLLLGLLYGCGLKVGEACRIRWKDIDSKNGTLRITFARGTRERWVTLPDQLLPVLRQGLARCFPGDYVFRGMDGQQHLSTRMAAIIVHRAAKAARMTKPVTGMTLRHSYAVHCLEAGATIRQVQEALGHQQVETTLIYQRCIRPGGASEQLDLIDGSIWENSDTQLFDEPLDASEFDIPFDTEYMPASDSFCELMKMQVYNGYLLTRLGSPWRIRSG